MDFSDTFLNEMEPRIQKAFEAMQALERGAIANPDENRMVGHYWLRTPALAPDPSISQSVIETIEAIHQFTRAIHKGEIIGQGGVFTDLLIIGIGGSALGPQFVAQALGHPRKDRLKIHFFDNTDPDGMLTVLAELHDRLGTTLNVVISKSGGTPETRNGMLVAQDAYSAAGLSFARHAIAVTGIGSKLDQVAQKEDWIKRFPMWDWVGGRTSEMGPVGLIPAALQGLDIDGMLKGASDMDAYTRRTQTQKNPAALLALMWYFATEGKGSKDMVILPYKDRLALFSRYLQQLVMESLGKEFDLKGTPVHQGIAVYGNKGSTDQHAYVQQLREGIPNFFATFIEVLNDQETVDSDPVEVEPGITSGDYLQGLLLGTREALTEKGRNSITITIDRVSPQAVGQLIALYERAVGLYAELIGINAYHQPGVEAGKKAAASTLLLKTRIQKFLLEKAGTCFTVSQIAIALQAEGSEEMIFKLLEHLSANPSKHIHVQMNASLNAQKYCHQKDTAACTCNCE
jgi:glucose-6-phosphate isomerase